jgi:hypothetical protein
VVYPSPEGSRGALDFSEFYFTIPDVFHSSQEQEIQTKIEQQSALFWVTPNPPSHNIPLKLTPEFSIY